VPSLSALLAAVLLGVTATLLAACGEEERTGLLSQTRAAQIKDGLADVEEAVNDGSCTRVREELTGLRTQLDQLPRSTDAELRDRLQEGVAHLDDIAPIECEGDETETEPETTPETTPETSPETAPPVETTPPPVETTPPPATTQPPAGEDREEGGAGDEQTPGSGNGPPGGTPPGQVPDSGGEEAPGADG
jgi:hypothetical protein